MRINIIGAGKLGQTLGYLFHKNGYTLGCVCNKTIESSLNSIYFIGSGTPVSHINELKPADVTLIATPDSCIEESSRLLAESEHLKPGSTIIHCSGALTSDVLIHNKRKSCFIASVHPMRSFANPSLSIAQYEHTYCAIEGDLEAIQIIEPMFQKIGSMTYTINKEKKSYYHAAGVFASNYVITLADQAIQSLNTAGVDNAISTQVIIDIMKGTISNLESTRSPQDALTGPLKRGDINTIQQHLHCFTEMNQKKLYALLGIKTLPLSSLSQEQQKELYDILALALN